MIRLSRSERARIVAYACRQIEYNRYSTRSAIEGALESICPRSVEYHEYDGIREVAILLSSDVYKEIEESVRKQVEMDRKLAKAFGQVLPMDEPIEP